MPLLCPNINSYKRLVGGEASPAMYDRDREANLVGVHRHSGLPTSFRTATTRERHPLGFSDRPTLRDTQRDSKSEFREPM